MLRTNVFPVPGGTYSNDWGGPRSGGRKHQGTDVFAQRGTPIVAVVDGTVTKMGPSKIGGNRVWINGTYYFAHMDSFAKGLKNGSVVKAGQVIGYVGTTGDAKGTPPHLHFGYDPTGGHGRKWENPYEHLNRWKQGKAFVEEAVTAAPTAAPTPGVRPAELEFGQGTPVGPPMPGLPGPELPGSSEIPYRNPDSPAGLWQLISPQSPEGRRFLDLATAGGNDS